MRRYKVVVVRHPSIPADDSDFVGWAIFDTKKSLLRRRLYGRREFAKALRKTEALNFPTAKP